MARLLNSAAILGARGVESSIATSCRSQFWGNSRHFFARQQQQQWQHSLLLSKQPSASLQVVNSTAPWLRWWDKDGAPNMVEISSMQQFVDELTNADERLVIVDFYSRGCAGCRSLYPKLCKIAREHPEVVFLKINFDDNTEICKALNVRMLPLFFVYRAQGRLDSFSCTISKIHRLKDAIAKYASEKAPALTLFGNKLQPATETVAPSFQRDAITV